MILHISQCAEGRDSYQGTDLLDHQSRIALRSSPLPGKRLWVKGDHNILEDLHICVHMVMSDVVAEEGGAGHASSNITVIVDDIYHNTDVSAAHLLPAFSLETQDEHEKNNRREMQQSSGGESPVSSPRSPSHSPLSSLPVSLHQLLIRLLSLFSHNNESHNLQDDLSVLLQRLLHYLSLPRTSLLFRRTAMTVLHRLFTSDSHTISHTSITFFTPHLYRLMTLILPKHTVSLSLVPQLTSMINSWSSLSGFPRATLSNIKKYVDNYSEDEYVKRKRAASPTLAYFAHDGNKDSHTMQPPADDLDPSLDEEHMLVEEAAWPGKKARRRFFTLLPNNPIIPIVVSPHTERESVNMIEKQRAEQKQQQREARLRAEGETEEQEWRRVWRETIQAVDVQLPSLHTQAAQAQQQQQQQPDDEDTEGLSVFWKEWRPEHTWKPFLPSSTHRPIVGTNRKNRSSDSNSNKQVQQQQTTEQQTQVQTTTAAIVEVTNTTITPAGNTAAAVEHKPPATGQQQGSGYITHTVQMNHPVNVGQAAPHIPMPPMLHHPPPLFPPPPPPPPPPLRHPPPGFHPVMHPMFPPGMPPPVYPSPLPAGQFDPVWSHSSVPRFPPFRKRGR